MTDYDQISLKLISNDGSEEFNLPATFVSFNSEDSLITRTIGAIDQEIGAVDVEISRRERVVEGVITENIRADDYPNSSTYTDDTHGYAIELEKIQSKNSFNLLSTGSTATVEWQRGGVTQKFPVVVTNVNTDYSAQTGNYEYSLEFRVTDVVFTVN